MPFRTCFLILAAFLSLTLITNPSNRAHAEILEWKWKVGDRYAVRIDQDSTINTRVEPLRTTVDDQLKLGMEMAWVVESIDKDGNAEMQQIFSRMQVELIRSRKQTIKYDTAEEGEPSDEARPYAEVYQELVKIRFKVTLSPRGEVLKVTLSNEDTDTIRKIPESMQARKLFEKRGLFEVLSGGGFVLPADEVKSGHQWTVEKQRKMTFGTAELKNTYQLLKIGDDGLADIKLDGKTELTDQPTNPSEKPLKLVEHSLQGSIQFQQNDGYLRQLITTQKMVTSKPYREMTIDTTSETITTLNIEKQ